MKRRPDLKNLIVLGMGILFLILCFEFLISFNWFPNHLKDTNLFDVGRRHYSDQLANLQARTEKINAHVVLAVIMLVTGLFQFNDRLRAQKPRVHRAFGYIYFGVGLITVSIGIYMSNSTIGGITAQISNYFVGTLWMLSFFYSLRAILRKETLVHKMWTYRNYVIAASTGLIRPIEVIIDKVFPGNTTAVLFGAASFTSLVAALLIWIFVPIVPAKKI